MSEEKYWALCLLAFIVGLVIIITATLDYYKHELGKFVEGNYHECVLPGSSQARWCK